MKSRGILYLFLTPYLWLCTACVSTVEQGSPTVFNSVSQISELIEQVIQSGEDVPFEICAWDQDWTRPVERQPHDIWESDRYRGTQEEILKYPWNHQFLISYGQASIDYELVQLSGLWTIPENFRTECFKTQDQIQKFQQAELWILEHSVSGIRRMDNNYVLTVIQNGQGAQVIHVPRPMEEIPLNFYLVNQTGNMIDSITELEYPYWPHPWEE